MLQKVIIKAKCIQSGVVRGYGGTEIHGWFFAMLKGIDSDLSTKIHNLDEKPFSIGPIHGGKKEKGRTFLEEGGEYSFSMASLDKEIGDVLFNMQSWLIGTEIQLGSGEFVIKEVLPIYGENGLSCYDIIENSTAGNSEITIKFSSPTSFRQQGTQELFPQSHLVFGSLIRKWNAFSPVQLAPELADSVLVVKKYNLKTELVDFGKYKIIGCVGTCTYQLDKALPDFQVKILNSLAFFAGISGVGYKTSMGLGDARFIK